VRPLAEVNTTFGQQVNIELLASRILMPSDRLLTFGMRILMVEMPPGTYGLC
jgi:hypothetical protein